MEPVLEINIVKFICRVVHTKFGTPYILCQSTCYQALYITLFFYVFFFECRIDFY